MDDDNPGCGRGGNQHRARALLLAITGAVSGQIMKGGEH